MLLFGLPTLNDVSAMIISPNSSSCNFHCDCRCLMHREWKSGVKILLRITNTSALFIHFTIAGGNNNANILQRGRVGKKILQNILAGNRKMLWAGLSEDEGGKSIFVCCGADDSSGGVSTLPCREISRSVCLSCVIKYFHLRHGPSLVVIDYDCRSSFPLHLWRNFKSIS